MYVVRTLDGSVASVKNYKYTAPKGFTSNPLYSQEYVSALLAELEAYIDALRAIAFHVSAGGYNAESVDAEVFKQKIIDGINDISDACGKRIAELEAKLDREQGMRAQNLEIKTLLAEKVKTLETKLWDSQQLVDAKSGSQIELRSQISSLEERNRKDMAWRGERICELEDSLEAAQKRIAELEQKLATPVRLPPLMDSELCGKYGAKYSAAANAHNNAITACSIAIRGAGFKSEATALKCVGDE